MNRLNITLILLMMNLVGCAGTKGDMRVKAVFLSPDATIELTDIEGLNMGELYAYDFRMRPKIGKYETRYTSRDAVKLAEKIELKWKLSGSEHTEIYEQVITRPKNIPEIIPRGA